jgi:UDP-N-acetylmuramyl pentapeptide phosphotransferase/UDP-N-acetylglucosamine-1-phosphate transferase
MEILLMAFGVAWLLTLLAVRGSRRFAHLAHDHDLSGPQKMHTIPVPRIGGIGIFGSVLVVVAAQAWLDGRGVWLGALLLLAALPAFAAGFIEDLTKRVSPRRRLLATALSAFLAALLVGALIKRTDIPGVDWLVASAAGSLLVTVFVVSGVANAVNIIDGFNGLASMCAVIMMTGIAYVAFQVGDREVYLLALSGIGAVLGFFLWNFPAGYIFLGDGGAYFLGFYVAELGILLIGRNAAVSPLFPLLVCIYPAFETLFSIYRRVVVRGRLPSMPDGIHLHSLVFKRLMRWAVGSDDPRMRTRRNSLTSPYLWVLCSMSVVPAVLFWQSSRWQMFFLLAFSVVYVFLYSRIVRFKTPRWLIFRR